MTITDVKRLTEEVQKLPLNRQIEVIDFVQFLLYQEQRATEREEARAWNDLVLAQAGSLTDWDNAEDEVWNDVPAV